MPNIHHRKILPSHWQERRSWKKAWELRQEDRANFGIGDFVILQEWDPKLKHTGCRGYTGNEEVCRIDLVLRGRWVVLSTTTIHVHYRHNPTYLLMDGRLCDDDEWGTEPMDGVELSAVLRIVKEHQAAQAEAEQVNPVQTETTDSDASIGADLEAFTAAPNTPCSRLAIGGHAPQDRRRVETMTLSEADLSHLLNCIDRDQRMGEIGTYSANAVLSLIHTINSFRAGRDQAVKNAEELEALLEASDAEIRKLKRHRLILTGLVRMFLAAFRIWASDRGGAFKMASVGDAWNRKHGHGAQWVAKKTGEK